MGHVVLPGRTCRALAAEGCAVRDVVVRPQCPAGAGVCGGVGGVENDKADSSDRRNT